MPRGGARLGSGPKKGTKYRKRQKPTPKVPTRSAQRKSEQEVLPPLPADPDSLTVIRHVMLTSEDEKVRLKAAEILAPYEHVKAADAKLGKKEREAEAAEQAAKGVFAPPAPPKLVVNNE